MSIIATKKEEKVYKVNPSLADYGRQVYEAKRTLRTTRSRPGVVDGANNIIFTDERVKELVDKNEYIKITDKGIMVLNCLDKHGRIVLEYIIRFCLFFDATMIHLRNRDCSKIMKYDKSSVSKGINNLLENEVIFKSDDNEKFWINISYFHKGNILLKYKAYIDTVLNNGYNFGKDSDNDEKEEI